MTSLEAVSSYLPPERIRVGRYLAAELGIGEQAQLYERFYGFRHIRREPAGTVADLLRAAAGKLAELRGWEHQVRYLVHAATIQLAAPYPRNALDEVRQALGLAHASAFSLTQHACASGLLAVDVCGRLLAADGDPDGLALILVGEKTFTRVAQLIPHSAVMGEATAAILVRHDGDHDRLLGYAVRTLGEYAAAPFLPPDLAAQFDQIYAATLAEVIVAAAARAGLAPADLALVLPHNVNRMSWARTARAIGLPADRIFLKTQPEIGHCFGADSFINYQRACELGRLQPGDYYGMTAVGLGATFAAMVFQH